MEKISDITECCICAEMFTDPRMLPCVHTFCLKCLEATRSNSENYSGDTMPCPLCRQQFTLPPDGLSGLRKNLFVEKLVKIPKTCKPYETKVPCDVCLLNRDESDTEIHDASKYCVECQENMCETCSIQHKRQTLLKDHQILPLEGELKDELAKTSAVTFCSQHDKDVLKMYCADCSRVICMKCFAENHQMHRCCDVNKVAEDFRNEIDIFLRIVVEGSKNGLERKRQLEEDKRIFLEELRLAENAIAYRATELRQTIDKYEEFLLDELSQIKTMRMKETESENADIDRHLIIFHGFNEHGSELKSKGTATDICRSIDELRTRAKDLQEAIATTIKSNTSPAHVSFKTSSNIEDMLKTENIVGSLEVQGMSLATLKTSEEYPVSVDFIKTLQCSLNVEAVTKLADKIYALCKEGLESGIELNIFEYRHPFNIYMNVWIEEINWYIGVASSDKFRCLYISDSSSRCVWKLTTDDYKVTKWLSNAGDRFIISVSNDGHLMLLRDEQGVRPNRCQVETYGPEAKISRKVVLSNDIVCPVDFVQESDGKFIIIHRLDDTFSESVISELSHDGHILRKFQSSEMLQELVNSFYVCLDKKNSRLFVAQADKVALFDLVSFKWKQNLLRYEDRFTPPLLHYDQRKKQLLVGRSREVSVYQVVVLV